MTTERSSATGKKFLEVDFKAYETCPKCGSTEQHRSYHANTHSLACDLFEFKPTCCDLEHHCMYCRGCGFQWIERLPGVTQYANQPHHEGGDDA